jgi:putative sigma-54 modulation protein
MDIENKIQLSSKNMEITPAIKELTLKKVTKLFHHNQDIMHIHLTFIVEKLSMITQADIHLSKHNIHASEKADDMYKSIDGLMHKLDTQLKKLKK